MRVAITRGSMSLGERDGGLPPQSVVQAGDTILADSERVVARFHEPGEGAMVSIALAPCSPFSVTREIMRGTAALARRLGVRLHTHLAETDDETSFCLERFGMRPLDYLEDCGWLGEDVWLAHGIHFDENEIARLGRAGTGVAHCPTSNMLLASGICPALDLDRAGAPLGLGVDGSASNDGSNMIQEVRQAMLVQKLRYGAEAVTWARALDWATMGSASCLGRADIGRIAVGAQADLALFRLDEPRFSGADDPLAALFLCGATRADAVMVAGAWRVREGSVVGLDLDALMTRHREAARSLAARAETAVRF
jgi:8-oxoguanine deaminase